MLGPRLRRQALRRQRPARTFDGAVGFSPRSGQLETLRRKTCSRRDASTPRRTLQLRLRTPNHSNDELPSTTAFSHPAEPTLQTHVDDAGHTASTPAQLRLRSPAAQPPRNRQPLAAETDTGVSKKPLHPALRFDPSEATPTRSTHRLRRPNDRFNPFAPMKHDNRRRSPPQAASSPDAGLPDPTEAAASRIMADEADRLPQAGRPRHPARTHQVPQRPLRLHPRPRRRSHTRSPSPASKT